MKRLLALMMCVIGCSRGGEQGGDVAFRIEGLSAFPDHVFFAYPCNEPPGPGAAPSPTVHAHIVLREGRDIVVPKGGGSCTVYAIAAREYAGFSHSYTPSRERTDPAMDAFRARALQCGAPDMSFKNGRRGEQVLTVTSVTEWRCEMKAVEGEGASGTR